MWLSRELMVLAVRCDRKSVERYILETEPRYVEVLTKLKGTNA
jgi:hypothetical protein